MGRKRNQGKARRAAKAKARARAREAEEEEERNYQTTNDNERQEQQELEAEAEAEVQMQQLQIGNDAPIADTDTDNYVLTCRHGLIPLSNSTCTDFMLALKMSYRKAITNDPRTASCLIDAENSTKVEFAEVWKDTNMMELAISCFLCLGTETMLNGKYDCARETATLTRYLEQRNAMHKTQAVMNLAKIEELALCSSDDHTLVKFYRRRIPCSCLDKKYEEVKSVAKIGVCFNAQCPFPDGMLERSLTMYCSRCRSVTYCSLECQKDQWTNHKEYCDSCVVLKADFEAKQQQQQQQQQQS
eukprot:scaffold586_cov112-Skeletonema_dohrnii-CCMP3373.AAC.17